jgi:hypothetical protein
MSFPTYADVLCPGYSFETGCQEPKERGTLVYLGMNQGPVYEIIFIEGPTAWIRQPKTYRGETLVPLNRLRVASPHSQD